MDIYAFCEKLFLQQLVHELFSKEFLTAYRKPFDGKLI